MINMLDIEKFAYTIKGIKYDIVALQQVYEELKPFRRTRALILDNKSKSNAGTLDPDKALQSQIMKTHSAVFDPNQPGYDVGKHPVVESIIKQFKIKIKPDLVDINCFRPGFEFFPHTDQVSCTIMFPIVPITGGAPVDFYYKEGLEIKPATEYRNIIKKTDRILEHYYSTEHPTIINQRQIHGVSKIDHDRVYLRFKVYDYSFEDLVNLDKSGNLV